MKPVGAVLTIIYYALGLTGSLAWAKACSATPLLGLLLWTSFFGSTMVLFLMLYWSREHWLD